MTYRSVLPAFACILAVAMAVMLPLDGAFAQSKPKAKKEGPLPLQLQSQCSWPGQRLVHSLLRDDTVAAKDHLAFYEQFNCPNDHLAKAFACAVDAPAGAGRPRAEILVENCWETLSPTRETEEDADAAAKLGRKQSK
ncbi:hypothetical protein [Emcibacter sp. SYSU 3D8]|uniref:hypothetical protein n=1 Tax=Emcibacter sp. SYSU 3D8 TaxID=3133969 RepID=UPI0031FE9AAF